VYVGAAPGRVSEQARLATGQLALAMFAQMREAAQAAELAVGRSVASEQARALEKAEESVGVQAWTRASTLALVNELPKLQTEGSWA
jgi:hypothetical protein